MRLHILSLLLLLALCAHAETIMLRTGARVKGTIVFQNEEVVIIRNEEGARFQYPREEVKEILAADVTEQTQDTVITDDMDIKTSKKASILIELGGGASLIPGDSVGGGFSADLLFGSHHIGSRHIFVGGGLGYHGMFIGAERYNFLPIQVALRMPFTEDKHSAVFGASLGYGIALSKLYLGGIYAGLDLGYRCRLNPRSAIALTFYAQFQQATLNVIETVEGVEFVNHVGRNIITPGLKFSFYF